MPLGNVLTDDEFFSGARAASQASVMTDADFFEGGADLSDDEFLNGGGGLNRPSAYSGATWGEVWEGFLNTLGPMTRRQIAGLQESGANGGLNMDERAAVLGSRFTGQDEAQIRADIEARRAETRQTARRIAEEATAEMQAARPDIDPESFKGYAFDFATSMVNMAPAVAATMITRNPATGAAMIGGQVYGDQYAESRQSGRTHDEAVQDGLFMAAAEGIPEMIPLGILARPGKSFVSRLFKGTAAESIQEMVTQAIQDGYSIGVLDEDMTWGEALNNLKRAGILGGAMGGSFAVATEPMVRGRRASEAAQSSPEGPPVDAGAPVGTEGSGLPQGAVPAEQVIGAVEPDAPATAPPKRMAPVTPEDEASPIDTATISRGKAILEDAAAGRPIDVDPPAAPVEAPTDGAGSTDAARATPGPEWRPLYSDSTRVEQVGWTNPATGEERALEATQQDPARTAEPEPVQPVAAPAQQASVPRSLIDFSDLAVPPQQDPAAIETTQQDQLVTPPIQQASTPDPQTLGDPEVSAQVTIPANGLTADPARLADAGRPPVDQSSTPLPEVQRVEQAAADVDPAPTEAQKAAGNYAKGHVRYAGFDVSIENPRGSERSGTDGGGNRWSVTMPAHYGYLRRTEGADGDHVDVYIGDGPETGPVFVVDQIDADSGRFDEHKVLMGFADQPAAEAAYRAGFSDGRADARMGAVTAMPMEQFKAWLRDGDQSKPVGQVRTTEFDVEFQRNRDAAIRSRQEQEARAAVASTAVDFARGERARVVDINRMPSGRPFNAKEREAFLSGYDSRVAEIAGDDVSGAAKVSSSLQHIVARGAQEVGAVVKLWQRLRRAEAGGARRVQGATDAENSRSSPASDPDVGAAGRGDNTLREEGPPDSDPANPEGYIDQISDLAPRMDGISGLVNRAPVADSWVREQGAASGGEHLAVLDVDGGLVQAGTQDKAASIDFSAAARDRLGDPEAGLVATHNHPGGTAPSIADVSQIAHEGIDEVRVVTDDALYSVFLPDKITGQTGDVARFRKTLDRIDKIGRARMRDAVNAGLITGARANAIYPHLFNVLLHRAGLTTYATTLPSSEVSAAERAVLDKAMPTAKLIAGSFSGIQEQSEADVYRSTVPVRAARGLEEVRERSEDARPVDTRSAVGGGTDPAVLEGREDSGDAADSSPREGGDLREERSRVDLTEGDIDGLSDDAAGRQSVVTRLIGAQPLDRLMRLPFDFFGGINDKGQWVPGQRLSEAAASTITEAEFAEDGRFAFMNSVLRRARAGLVDRYGLDPAYIERDRQRDLDEQKIAGEVPELMRTLQRADIGPEEARILQSVLTGEAVADEEMQKLSAPVREAIDAMGQEAVDLGLLSAEAFERNRGAYLRRAYFRHEAGQNALLRWVSRMAGSRRRKIIGEQFKGRGLWIEVAPSKLAGDPVEGQEYLVLDKVEQDAGDTVWANDPKRPKVRSRVFVPGDQKVPDEYADFAERGIWQVRGTKNGKVVLWRDFTKPEREQMGEILDARYTIAKTYAEMAHDLSVGRLYRDIAANSDWSTADEPPSRVWKGAGEYNRFWADPAIQWVKVPSSNIPKTTTKRYGKLAGRWVRAEIWRDLSEVETMQTPGWWNTLLTQWKLNKTARSPVTHANNVMSNLMLMDLADVRMIDLGRAIRSMVRGDADYRAAVDGGAFGSDMVSIEIRKSVLEPILEEVARDMRGGSETMDSKIGLLTTLSEAIWSRAKSFDRKMVDLYRLEDEVFRMATYLRRRETGYSPKDAALDANEQFLNYNIRAPWVNAARRSVLPFISYTYRAAPVIAKSIAHRPWKLAKYFTVAFIANELAYALNPGDEDEERRSLRADEQGFTWIGAPRMVRMPWADGYGNPVFLDVRRFVPAGDIFDVGQGSSALPLPSWAQFGGPLMLGAELFLNRSAFTGQDLTDPYVDTTSEKVGKVGEYLWKSWMPSAAWIPGSWYFEKIGNALAGARDYSGRPYSVGQALLSSVGIKVKPQDVAEGFRRHGFEFGRIERALQAEANRLARDRDRGLISQSRYDRDLANIALKADRLGEVAEKTFEGE